MTGQFNPFVILNVTGNATDEEIKNQYRLLMKQNHPDLSHSSNAEEMSFLITKAYKMLINAQPDDRKYLFRKFTAQTAIARRSKSSTNTTEITEEVTTEGGNTRSTLRKQWVEARLRQKRKLVVEEDNLDVVFTHAPQQQATDIIDIDDTQSHDNTEHFCTQNGDSTEQYNNTPNIEQQNVSTEISQQNLSSENEHDDDKINNSTHTIDEILEIINTAKGKKKLKYTIKDIIDSDNETDNKIVDEIKSNIEKAITQPDNTKKEILQETNSNIHEDNLTDKDISIIDEKAEISYQVSNAIKRQEFIADIPHLKELIHSTRMQPHRVKSKIQHIGYNAQYKILYVSFAKMTFAYIGIPNDCMTKLLLDTDPMKFWKKYIKKAYFSVKLNNKVLWD